MAQVLHRGISRWRLYKMLDDGVVERISRGVYRLSNIARETDRPFQEVLQYFAMERFLLRLSLQPQRAGVPTASS